MQWTMPSTRSGEDRPQGGETWMLTASRLSHAQGRRRIGYVKRCGSRGTDSESTYVLGRPSTNSFNGHEPAIRWRDMHNLCALVRLKEGSACGPVPVCVDNVRRTHGA